MAAKRMPRRAKEPSAKEILKALQKPVTPLPDDLQKMAGAYHALDQTAQLLQIGLFPGAASAIVAQCGAFIGELRAQQAADIRRHPEGEKVLGS